MEIMLVSALVGLALGYLIGYYFQLWLVVVATAAAALMVRGIFRTKGSGALGAAILLGPGLCASILAMWIAYAFSPTGDALFALSSIDWKRFASFFVR